MQYFQLAAPSGEFQNLKQDVINYCSFLISNFLLTKFLREGIEMWKNAFIKQFQQSSKQQKKYAYGLCLPLVQACKAAKKLMKEWIEKNKEQFRTFEENTKTALTFLVGAFVKLMVARWWAQTSKIPKLNRLAIRMNALMREGIIFVYFRFSFYRKVASSRLSW